MLWLICFSTVGSTYAQQSALDPASSQAENIAVLWWIMFYSSVVIFIAVMALLIAGLWRSRKSNGRGLSATASRNLVVAAGVVVPLAVLIAFVGGSLMLGRSVAAPPPENSLTVAVTGYMWWWEIEYFDEQGRTIAVTANELHVPVSRPVSFQLKSADVIHSFWVPQLHGKTDMVPGVVNTSWFAADKPGVYRGQCAEFCGAQHAHMAFIVVAQPEQEFQQWLEIQAQPAMAPDSPQAERGQSVFMSAGCADCHTIRGTVAEGQLGPDLTHFGSRRTLAAATRPNTRGHLGGWISDPQSLKPGSFMPRTLLGSEELTALITYLESLQ